MELLQTKFVHPGKSGSIGDAHGLVIRFERQSTWQAVVLFMAPHETDRVVSDVDLLKRIANGEEDAFSLLYDRFTKVLYFFAMKILRNEREAEDILQSVFLKVWQRAYQYNDQKGTPQNWLLGLTRNTTLDHIRSAKRRERFSETIAASEVEGTEYDSITTIKPIIESETARLVRTALRNLPANQREAIEMAFFDGMTQSSIAETLDQPLGTIKARIRRGMAQLRNWMPVQ